MHLLQTCFRFSGRCEDVEMANKWYPFSKKCPHLVQHLNFEIIMPPATCFIQVSKIFDNDPDVFQAIITFFFLF